ncbi:hypothetical protein AURDEDRAFT_92509 [Auricularia subglabra TFB-10046 SS5]|uniref:Uncharacterized protein n=1 Tax=Auricularia subglabra (strain TFB-10046 / SS5) TaxID=717982 RepID=J0WTL8_AURST|nr:hypothetical protein AURDEDRAFT_92509 [Auricularia subglabra TFB-10046 SS5]
MTLTAGPASEEEATLYYAGLPSRPRLVYRSSTTPWALPPDGRPREKELYGATTHKLNKVWDELAPKVVRLFDDKKVQFTSIDIVRFQVEDDPIGPPVIWVGVAPDTVTSEQAKVVADGCLSLLHDAGIDDVEVEFRVSVVWLL